MTITTMKEARERCAQLGITPARSLAETLARIENAEKFAHVGATLQQAEATDSAYHAEDAAFYEGTEHVPEPIAAMAAVMDEMPQIERAVAAAPELGLPYGGTVGKMAIEGAWLSDRAARKQPARSPASVSADQQRRLRRKQMRKATQRAQRRHA